MQCPCLLDAGHNVDEFDCGTEVLNEYLAKYALQNQRNGSGRTHVVLDGNRVIGFYTIASSAVEPEKAPERLGKGSPRHAIPAVILGRFAVYHRYQGQGVGSALLRDALLRIAQVSEEIGIRAVIVDAKDEKARAFYMKVGFTPFAPEELRLYMLLKDLRKTLGL
jgi:GNAT superfamily N-acetyltransferase